MKKTLEIILLFLFSQKNLIFAQENVYTFTPGQYYILDYPINIRSQPNLGGEIIGKLNLHDRIEIIQPMNNIQSIEGIWANWYKIKFNGIIGYIFGGYIAVNRLVFDIDKNGIDDFVYFRFSNTIGQNNIIDSYSDIIIYVNNQKISTSNMYRDVPENHYWMWCELDQYVYIQEMYSDTKYIRIGLSFSKGIGFPDEIYYYRIYGNGNIVFDYKNLNIGIGF